MLADVGMTTIDVPLFAHKKAAPKKVRLEGYDDWRIQAVAAAKLAAAASQLTTFQKAAM